MRRRRLERRGGLSVTTVGNHRCLYRAKGDSGDFSTEAEVNVRPVSVYFDDAKKIVDLFAGKAMAPPYDKLNWDAKRVWNLDPKKFAVFGPDDAAKRIADALKAKGMTVEVNPKYEIKDFVREPGRGGATATFGVGGNFENINAHAIVLPGSSLLQNSFEPAISTGPSRRRSPAPRPRLRPVGRQLLSARMGRYFRGRRPRRRLSLAARRH